MAEQDKDADRAKAAELGDDGGPRGDVREGGTAGAGRNPHGAGASSAGTGTEDPEELESLRRENRGEDLLPVAGRTGGPAGGETATGAARRGATGR